MADTYPDAPGFKASGPSEQAAERMTLVAGTMRARVLDWLRQHPDGMTADELAHALNISPFTVRPRLSELRRNHLIEDTGERRTHDSGMTATVWRATP